MDDDDVTARIAGLGLELAAVKQALAGAGAVQPADAELLALAERALPDLDRLYREHRDALPSPPPPLRGTAGAPARPLQERLDDLRRDLAETIRPLEVLGKWPPDPVGFVHAKPPDTAAPFDEIAADEPPIMRSTGRWPPEGFEP